jgi:hypothetical protein
MDPHPQQMEMMADMLPPDVSPIDVQLGHLRTGKVAAIWDGKRVFGPRGPENTQP